MSLFKNYFFYNLLEKYTLVFGDLFSDIQVQKIGENGDVISTITVPVNYAEKEKWAQRQLDDSDLSRKPAIILPRISYHYTDINCFYHPLAVTWAATLVAAFFLGVSAVG